MYVNNKNEDNIRIRICKHIFLLNNIAIFCSISLIILFDIYQEAFITVNKEKYYRTYVIN